tara:strand:+ start:921 stop:1472 length:552 start_codon:yes stop_codon:yes gene_type:complete
MALTRLGVNNISNSTIANVTALPAAIATGDVLQVVSTKKSSSFTTTANSWTGVTGFNVDITPSATSSKVYVLVTCGSFITDNGNARAQMKVIRDSTDIALGDAATGHEVSATVCGRSNDGAHHQHATVISVLDSPNTTSQVTYSVQVQRGSDHAGVICLNRSGNQDSHSGNTISTITAMEIKG